MHGRLINGGLEYAPINYKLDDGRIIMNFNKDEELMQKYGYKNVTHVIPDYDSTTQYIQISNYTETDENITVNYEVVNLPTPIPTVAELFNRIVSIENELLQQTTILEEEVNK